MSITEVYMGPGDFRVSMSTATPWLMSQVESGGYLVITPQHIGDPRGFTNDNILDAARYSGIVINTIWTNGVLTIEGASLEWVLGDLDGIGWPCPSRTFSSTAISSVIALTSGTGIIPAAGFSIGSTITGSAYTGTHGTSETVKEVLAQVMDQVGNHYRIYPDGRIETEATTSNNVFKATPEIVFVRDNWGSDAMYTGLPVTSLKSSHSIREWLHASGIDFYGINNTTLERVDTTAPITTRQRFGAEYKMQEIRLPYAQLDQANAAAGDNVYIFDPGSGFQGEATDIIWFRGQCLNPAKHRIHEVTWPLVDGMGIYYRPGSTSIDSGDWIDLTHTTKTVSRATAQTYVRALATNVD
jgi:hypothetical protein